MQSKSDDINEEKKDNQDNKNFYDSEKIRSSIGTFIKQMADLNSLVSIGPFTSLMNDPNLNLNALKEYGNLLVRYQSNLNFYISAMTKAYFLAINKIASSATEKMTSEEFRKITINTFEDSLKCKWSYENKMIYRIHTSKVYKLNHKEKTNFKWKNKQI